MNEHSLSSRHLGVLMQRISRLPWVSAAGKLFPQEAVPLKVRPAERRRIFDFRHERFSGGTSMS
jgi:hypothetical protein